MELQEQRKFPCKFNLKRVHKVGRMIRDQWEKAHDYTPPLVQSVEATGVYRVIDYPAEFIPEMDAQIFAYLKLVEDIYFKKLERAQHQLSTYTPTPIKRIRKKQKLPLYSASSRGVK